MAAPSKLERDRGYTQADIEDVSDTPEFTEEEIAKAKPFAEVFPELAASAKRTRGKQGPRRSNSSAFGWTGP